MGCGRSGTTILGILLHNNSEIYHVGEINKFFEFKGEPHGFGPNTEHYETYKTLFNNHFKDIIDRDLNIAKKIEFHTQFLKALFGFHNNSIISSYFRNQIKLYNLLFTHFKSNVIVDSSKYPTRPLLLKKIKDYDINIIYLRRNFTDVAKSFAKKNLEQPSKSLFSALLYYMCVNIASTIVYFIYPKEKRVYVSFNCLVRKPTQTIEKIQNKLSLNLTESISIIKNNKQLSTGLIFEGNRVRLKDKLHFKH
jgi:hypothetical protein